jgi:hypothetical protein
METRNKISHEIYCPPPNTPEQIKEQALVSDKMLKQARWLLKEIPSKCVKTGAKAYPSFFRDPST